MTRRIVMAILLTMGAVLLLSDGITYGTIRALLLRDLDETIVSRVALLPQVEAHLDSATAVTTDTRDRYVIKNDHGQSVGRRPVPGADNGDHGPQVLHAGWTTLADGQTYRTLTIRAMIKTGAEGVDGVPVTIVYSGSAAHFVAMLRELALTLAAANVLALAATSLVVRRVSRSALRPLSATAATIGSIDERHLDRRIHVEQLPSELLPMAQRLNEMLARLEESATRRSRFVSDASHELRAPLAAVMTGMEVCLRRPRNADEYRRAIEQCLQDMQSLRSLVETLMEQVKSERPEQIRELEPVDVEAVLGSVVRMAKALAEGKEVTVLMQPTALPLMRTSEDRLRSIVMNLLSNAVEYNRPGGRVELQATCAQGQLTIVVRDTGVGIPAADLPRLTEPFYRVDKTRKPSAGHHLGLGLSLVQAHVATLGGTVSLESEVGQGTIATIVLPAEECAADIPRAISDAGTPISAATG